MLADHPRGKFRQVCLECDTPFDTVQGRHIFYLYFSIMMAVSAALRGAWCIGASSPLSWSRCGGIEFGGLRNAIEAVRVFF